METTALYTDDQWPYVLTLLPPNLEALAKATGALVRQRNVPDAAALIRLALAYAVSDLSLKDVAAWAGALGVAEITGPGLFYRMREAETWLKQVLAATLQTEIGQAPAGHRLRIVDATVINGPGSKGTHWRAHVQVNPATGGLHSVELTDKHEGEGLALHRFEPGDIVVGDRCYCMARGVHEVIQAKADVVVRLNPQSVRMFDAERQPLSLSPSEAPTVGVIEHQVLIPVPPKRSTKSHKTWKLETAVAWFSARVLVSRTRAGRVMWVLTTLPADQWPAHSILVLYRFRWQIELLFKRLKSLLHLDSLPSRMGPTAKSWMLARLLAAALAHKLTPTSGALSPWGYEIRPARIHP